MWAQRLMHLQIGSDLRKYTIYLGQNASMYIDLSRYDTSVAQQNRHSEIYHYPRARHFL